MTDDQRHWSSDAVLTGALERYGERMERGAHELTLDLSVLQEFIFDGDSPAYQLMNGMHTVWRDEGMDGYRGAPRLVMALLQLLSERSAIEVGRKSDSGLPTRPGE